MEELRGFSLHWDEGPAVGAPAGPNDQGQQREKHAAAACRLLETGHAFYAFKTRAELTVMRRAAQQRAAEQQRA